MLNTIRSRKRLGIILGENELRVCECELDAGRIVMSPVVRFNTQIGNHFERLIESAEPFRQFLLEHSLRAKQVIFGLPGRHVLMLPHDLPRVDAATTAMALWHHGSRVLPPELGSTVLDFIGDDRDGERQQVMMVGLQTQLADRLRNFCRAVGLQAECALPTTVALANASRRISPDAIVFYQQGRVTEVLVQSNGLPQSLRALSSASVPAMQSEVRRAAAQLPQSGVNANHRLLLWGDVEALMTGADWIAATGLSPTRTDANFTRLKQCEFADSDCLPMAALFDAATDSARPCVNLFKPRIREPRVQRVNRKRLIGSALAAFLVLAVGISWFDLHRLQRDADRSQAELDGLQSDVKVAKPQIQRMQFLSEFASDQPRYLACLRDLTEAVATLTSVQLSTFDLNGAMQGACSGEASAEKDALDLVDRLNASKRFARLNCRLESHTAAGSRGEKVSFRIAFGYLPVS